MRNKVIAGLSMAALIVLAAVIWRVMVNRSAAAQFGRHASVPVSVATVTQRDLPQMLTAVGNVQSLNAVTLRSQIDGVLTKVLVKEGQRVEQGQLLALIDDRTVNAMLDQAQAEKSRNQATLKVAQLDLQRDQNLLAEEAISRQTVEQQRALVEQLQATVQSNDAAINAVNIQRSYTRIVAPVTGRVGFRRVDPGNLIHANDADGLFSVVQLDPISVVFSLPQQELTRLQPLLADPSKGEVALFDRDSGTELARGHLVTLDNQVDATTGTLRLRAEFTNSKGLLWPGQFVTAQLRTNVDVGAVVIDSRAVRQGLSGAYVFKINKGVAQLVSVSVKYEQNSQAAIGSGLKPGDVVVTDGQSQLTDGASVSIVTDAYPAGASGTGITVAQ